LRKLQHIPSRLDHENDFIAGAPALDFANTVGGSRERPTHDHITRYADLVEFAEQRGDIGEGQAKNLLDLAKAQPAAALAVLERALRLRDAIWSSFPAERNPKPKDVATISAESARSAGHMRLVPGAHSYVWSFSDDIDLERVIWPIARSAADLLTSKTQRSLVRECESDTCSWLFIDKTRNHSRRWCDMGDCGNRAKARRFRERRRRAARSE
jgi:predicted RNA-binding Zn ribbon-like protein